MMGIYVIVGASLLGAFSCMLIAWSLWSRAQVRKRARQRQLATGQHAAVQGHPGAYSGGYPVVSPKPAGVGASPTSGHTVVAPPPAGGYAHEDEPRTEFMSSAELFGQVDEPEEPTQFLSSAELFEDPGADEHEPATEFMSSEELFGARSPGPGPSFRDDEHEPPTEFMSDAELFGRRSADEPSGTVVLASQQVDRTIVLAGGVPEAQPPAVQRTAQPPAPAPTPTWARPPEPKPAPPPAPMVKPLASAPAPPKPPAPATPYGAFVGDRSQDDDATFDDDEFDDEHDPETELVHQAELLRLISPPKPGE